MVWQPNDQPARRRRSGFTLLEMLIVVVIGGVLLVLAAPSFKDMILLQRLRGVNSQIATDMQFARAEAAARNELMRVRFGTNLSLTCYVIYTATDNSKVCDCRLGAGSACTDPSTREVRTVVVPRDTGVVLTKVSSVSLFAFDSKTGGIYTIPTDLQSLPLDSFEFDATIGANRVLAVQIGMAGRIRRCAPAGSTVSEVAC